MKGIISKGESLKFEFDAEQIGYHGENLMGIRTAAYTKGELVKLMNHGVIRSWKISFDEFYVELNTSEVEWED